jgi:hypothetical protein
MNSNSLNERAGCLERAGIIILCVLALGLTATPLFAQEKKKASKQQTSKKIGAPQPKFVVTNTGAPGTNGGDGNPGSAGGPGGPANANATSTDADNEATATGVLVDRAAMAVGCPGMAALVEPAARRQ